MHVSPEDVELIQQHGVPVSPGPEFVLFSGDAISFTERGKRMYRLALLLHGLSPEPVEDIRTRADLRDLALKVKRVRVIQASDETERALNNGKIPAKAREIVEAVLHGTPEDLHAATERRLQLEALGSNIIPVSFRPRKSAQK